jgi:hypothetical protein
MGTYPISMFNWMDKLGFGTDYTQYNNTSYLP